MSEPYGLYLENPRARGRGGRFVSRRRRSSRRRRRSRARRRRNPERVSRRRRSSRRRHRSRSHRRSYSRRNSYRRHGRHRRHRRNPFSIGGGSGNIKRTVFQGLGLAGGELLGDLVSRVAIKVGVGKLFDVAKVPANWRSPLLRIGVGLFATPLLRKVRVLPASVTSAFGAVNVASGLLALTSSMREATFAKVGLGDYELADVLVGGDGMGDVLVGDYETVGDYELSGDYSDQDYYLNYES